MRWFSHRSLPRSALCQTQLLTYILLTPLLTVIPTCQLHAEPQVFADQSLLVATDYLFRGLVRDDRASLQPASTVGLDSASGGVIAGELWMHIPLDDDDGRLSLPDRNESFGSPSHFTEADLTLSYTYPFGPLSFGAGNRWFSYPDSADPIPDSAEAYVQLGFDSILEPQIIVAYDYRSYDSFYYELNLQHRFDYPNFYGLNVTTFTSLGWHSSDDSRYQRNGLSAITWGALSEIPIRDFRLIPHASYNQALDDASTSTFWAGIALSYTFSFDPQSPLPQETR